MTSCPLPAPPRHRVLLLAAASLAFLLPFGTVSCERRDRPLHRCRARLAPRAAGPVSTSTTPSERLDGRGRVPTAATDRADGPRLRHRRRRRVAWRGLGGGFAVAASLSLILLLLDAGVELGRRSDRDRILARPRPRRRRRSIVRARSRWRARRARRQARGDTLPDRRSASGCGARAVVGRSELGASPSSSLLDARPRRTAP